MAKGKAATRWRQLLVLLIVTSGATLAWVKARRRLPGSMPRSWSELNPAAPASLKPVSPAPVDTPAEPERVQEPERFPEAAQVSRPEQAAEPAAPVAEATAMTAPNEGALAGPYPGSVLPLADGSAPSDEFVVKGNAGSMRSHSASSPYFGRTRAEVWFRSQEDAEAAGFAPWAPKK